MEHELKRLKAADGSWAAFEADWSAQCVAFDEDFGQFAQATIGVLRDLAEQTPAPKAAATFGLWNSETGAFDAVAQLNSTLIPGHDGKVLRIRHLLLSPYFDFGDYPIETYSTVLSRMFAHTASLSVAGTFASRHIKFHLRSPADRQFFAGFVEPMAQLGIFSKVVMRGAWLYLSLK